MKRLHFGHARTRAGADGPAIPFPTLFALDGLKLTRRDGVLWIEGALKPLDKHSTCIRRCYFSNEDSNGLALAAGPRDYLETLDDCPVRIVVPKGRTERVTG